MAKTESAAFTNAHTATASSLTGANWIPPLGSLVALIAGSRRTTSQNTPTVSIVDSSLGVDGFTMDSIVSLQSQIIGTDRRVTLFAGIVNSVFGTGSGHFVFDWAAQSQTEVIIRSRKVVGSVGALSIVQTAKNNATSTTPNVNLSALSDAANAILFLLGMQSDSPTITDGDCAGTGTNNSAGNTISCGSGWADPAVDNTPGFTINASINWGAFALEIHEATSTVPPMASAFYRSMRG